MTQKRSGDTPKPDSGPSKRSAEETTDAVAKRLRALYDETLNEPVPQELSDLVQKLLEADKGRGSKDDD